MSPEEIAVQAGQQVPFLRLPVRASLFAERETRLRQLAAGHAMRDFLLFAAEIARAQHSLLNAYPDVALPTPAQINAAAQAGTPTLPAAAWVRDPLWQQGLQRLLAELAPRLVGSPAQVVVQVLLAQSQADAESIERQADRLLSGVMRGLDLALAPLIAAALQVYWVHLVIATEAARGTDRLAPFGRTDDATHCPCCGSRPTASITHIGGTVAGHRYVHCALCQTQWHMVRIKCTHCENTKGITYQSARPAEGHVTPATAAAADAVQAESCEACGHYLKVVHMEKDQYVEPVADDLASLTLDLLVADSGLQRHGINLLLLFGDPELPPGAPPGPGGA
ncbi:formate dehydrogenase accessory protein FdhE [Ideonella sp.]|uniref:formate dehydrogenase accessory protein FdhE n=1 Tax=Ideonella sp. TaxID=1929293 RepID=UPI003BB5F900